MQLVYFNDLHKNLGCNRGITAKISIIPVTFTVLPVKFYALQLPPAPIFLCLLSPSADKRPVETDISIAQKTCVFRPVDISVPTAKRNELIYQSVYSLSVVLAGAELPQSNPIGFASSLWEGAFGMAGKFLLRLILYNRASGVRPLRLCFANPPLPKGEARALPETFPLHLIL